MKLWELILEIRIFLGGGEYGICHFASMNRDLVSASAYNWLARDYSSTILF